MNRQRGQGQWSELAIPLFNPLSKERLVLGTVQAVGDVGGGENSDWVGRLIAVKMVVLALGGPHTRVSNQDRLDTLLAGRCAARIVLHSNDVGCKH